MVLTAPTDPAILAIPTFGTSTVHTRLDLSKPWIYGTIPLCWSASMILFSPVTPSIQVVGMFGRACA